MNAVCGLQRTNTKKKEKEKTMSCPAASKGFYTSQSARIKYRFWPIWSSVLQRISPKNFGRSEPHTAFSTWTDHRTDRTPLRYVSLCTWTVYTESQPTLFGSSQRAYLAICIPLEIRILIPTLLPIATMSSNGFDSKINVPMNGTKWKGIRKLRSIAI